MPNDLIIDETPRPPERADRHQPVAHAVAGCGLAAFAAIWTMASGLVAYMLGADQPSGVYQGSQESLALHNLALFQLPFFYPAVVLWWVALAQLQQVWLRQAGLARIRRIPGGWLAEIPSARGFLLAVGAFQLTLFLTALTPLVLLGKRNPLWIWYLAGPLAVFLGLLAYRRWRHRATVRVDSYRSTLSFSRGRRKPPLVVPWAAVEAIEVVVLPLEESHQYDCQVTVRVGEGAETFRFSGYSYPEPAERFALWLRKIVMLEMGKGVRTPVEAKRVAET